jgi:hypothetical protein
MQEAFVTSWNNSQDSTGLPPSTGGGGVITGSGDVKSVTVYDAFKLDYDVGATAVGGETSAQEATDLWGWLSPWQTVLSHYRSGLSGTNLGVV